MVVQLDLGDILSGISTCPDDSTFLTAIKKTDKRMLASDDEGDYLAAFVEEYRALSPYVNLAVVFNSVAEGMDDSTAIAELRREVAYATDMSINIIRKRLDLLEIKLPEIETIDGAAGKIGIVISGDIDTNEVCNIIEQQTSIEFYETYDLNEIRGDLSRVAALESSPANTGVDEFKTMLGRVDGWDYVTFGYAETPEEVVKITTFMDSEAVRSIMPKDFELRWSANPEPMNGAEVDEGPLVYRAYALRTTKGGPAIDGSVVANAEAVESRYYNGYEIDVEMNNAGARLWENLTKNNKGRSIAIVIDNGVYMAPRVNEPIKGGRLTISGNMTEDEADELATKIRAGKLGARAYVVVVNVERM